MNNKGLIPVKVLVGLVITIALFVPFFLFLNEILRVTDQSENSFFRFAEELNLFAKEAEGSKSSFSLIMDKKTAIMKFSKGKKASIVEKKFYDFDPEAEEGGSGAELGIEEYITFFEYPQTQCQGEDCICLCQKYEEDYEVKEQYNCDDDLASCFNEKELKEIRQEAENLDLDPKLNLVQTIYFNKQLICKTYLCSTAEENIEDFLLIRDDKEDLRRTFFSSSIFNNKVFLFEQNLACLEDFDCQRKGLRCNQDIGMCQ